MQAKNSEAMKKYMIETLAVLAAMSAFTACQKDETSSLAGRYTYKASGTVTVQTRVEEAEPGEEVGEETTPEEPQVFTFNLVNEEGQMSIIEQSADSLLVACNAIGGDAYTFTALENATDSLLISGTPVKSISVNTDAVVRGHGNVGFTGGAKLYDDVLVYTCKYSGVVSIAGVEMDIIDSDVEIVARKN